MFPSWEVLSGSVKLRHRQLKRREKQQIELSPVSTKIFNGRNVSLSMMRPSLCSTQLPTGSQMNPRDNQVTSRFDSALTELPGGAEGFFPASQEYSLALIIQPVLWNNWQLADLPEAEGRESCGEARQRQYQLKRRRARGQPLI